MTGPRAAEPGTVVFVALGANLGDALARIRAAVRELTAGLEDARVSALYRSRAEDGSEQPDYLNAVVRGRTRRTPREMLAWARTMEAAAGRTRPYPGAPRSLDVDLVFHGDHVVDDEELTLPHARWDTRPFVVVPLLELDPDWRDPHSGRTVREVATAAAWPDAALVRVLDAEALSPAAVP